MHVTEFNLAVLKGIYLFQYWFYLKLEQEGLMTVANKLVQSDALRRLVNGHIIFPMQRIIQNLI